ncbi:hypothetical protein MXB_1578 [Myxobolus squamalis]|nr:hypothetical protein MXB_1578 [Myxobolus squamalis]
MKHNCIIRCDVISFGQHLPTNWVETKFSTSGLTNHSKVICESVGGNEWLMASSSSRNREASSMLHTRKFQSLTSSRKPKSTFTAKSSMMNVMKVRVEKIKRIIIHLKTLRLAYKF